jgi:ketosteroid isomerase-like protein
MDKEIKNKAEQAFKNHLKYLSDVEIEKWTNLFTEDGVLEFPYAPKDFPTKVEGKQNLYGYMKNFPEHFKVTFTSLYFHPTANPNLVIAEFESDGVALSTNNRYEQKYISVVTVDDSGKIKRYVDFWNPIAAMEALGVSINGEGLSQQFISS